VCSSALQPQVVRIKICGITRLEDAMAAATMGADALGFVFAASPRRILPERAREIIAKLPPFLQTVGVFVNASAEEVARTASWCGLNVLQFHGNESVDYCRRFAQKVIKAQRVRNQGDLSGLSAYTGVTAALLLDTFVSGMSGGTGTTFDWELARQARQYGRIIVAGGLTPENVAAAISKAKPYGVDASSGLEKSPGVKDHDKMRQFIKNVRQTILT